MIITRVNGGLGNQMFQYAIAKALAIEFKTDIFLDLQDYENSNGHPFALDKFTTQFRIASSKELRLFGKIPDYGNPLWLRVLRKIITPTECTEKDFHYSANNLDSAGKYTYLSGYWQCEKYFIHIREQLLQDFKPRLGYSSKTNELLSKAQNTKSVSIHIRRGDYVQNPSTNSYHGTCSIDYYKSAINEISRSLDNPSFFVFSDDIIWAKENLNLWDDMFFVDHNDINHAWEDLMLMANCKHNIIANSTFSWWGAWLNNNVNKIVIAPDRWFNNANLDYKDVVPETWIKI